VPTYQYACTACGNQLEAVQSFTDEPLTECPVCEGRLRKVFSSVGIVFKGSGFYRTDSRAASSASASSSESASKNGSKDSGDKSSGDKGSGDGAKSAPKKESTAAAPAASGSTKSGSRSTDAAA
jgi:putative FmdB family regulatory protein